MIYEVVKSKNEIDEWRVEAINYAGDGECYLALFSGLQAQERAEQYAAWKKSHQADAA